MKRAQRRQQGLNAFDVIEEATHLLRTAPVATLTIYYLGTIPFVLGLLFFWADMSRSPLASQHIASASFGLALLFFWMKFCQSLFARQVRAQAARETFVAPGFRRGLRIFFMQGIIQSTGLFLLPLAAVPILSLPWVYAFYQNSTVLDTGEDAGTAALMKKSWRQARLWAQQNYTILLILLAFASCVFLNWMTVCTSLPKLGKTLFGIESEFTTSPWALLNTTFFTAMFGLTYLCVDPIVKTIYTLRCFYGESLESGEDLKAELAPFIHSAAKAVAMILIVCTFLSVTQVSAETAAPAPTSGQTVEAPDLDHAINQTIHERKYIWRIPREKAIEPEQEEQSEGVISKFFTKGGKLLRTWVRNTVEWIGKILQKLMPHRRQAQSSTASGTDWMASMQVLIYVLAAAVLIALAIFIIRLVRNRQAPVATAEGEAIAPVPDLTDENIRADQLPEDGWTKLARELLERGEFRLAMRAFYLAGLAHLAARNLISIARFKSNRDYERELRRRAHAIPNLTSLFGDTILNFERVWYGTHEATIDLAQQFAAGIDKLKASG